jgi:hypothetical protein
MVILLILQKVGKVTIIFFNFGTNFRIISKIKPY